MSSEMTQWVIFLRFVTLNLAIETLSKFLSEFLDQNVCYIVS